MIDLYRTLFHEWKNRKLPNVIGRDVSLLKYATIEPKKIIVTSGFRRTGKTYLLFHLIKELLKDQTKEKIIYINFEDERIPSNTEFLTGLIPAIKQVYGKPEFLFLDEVHNIPNWSKWLRRVYDTEEIRFFVTGSSSKLSSKEIPTELRGRFLELTVLPLSFMEFLRFKNISSAKKTEYSTEEIAEMQRLLMEYLKYGGLPEVVLATEDKKIEILQGYYNTIIRRDIIERFRIKSEENLKTLIRLLLNSTQYTITKLYNSLKSLNYEIGKSTIQTFLDHIENAYFMYSVYVFSPKAKNQLQWPRKVYFIDTGFISQLSTKFSRDMGRLYENIVFLELKRKKAKNPNLEIFYWKNQLHEEIDFVIKRGLKVKQLIQVCYNASDLETKKREIRALSKASKELKCRNLLIITEEMEGKEKINSKTIKYQPLWKWLLSKNEM